MKVENLTGSGSGSSGWRAACLDCDWHTDGLLGEITAIDYEERTITIERTLEMEKEWTEERANRHVNEEGSGFGHTAILIQPDGGVDHIVRSRWGEKEEMENL